MYLGSRVYEIWFTSELGYGVSEIRGILYEKTSDFLMALLALMRIQAYGSKALQ